MHVITLHGYIVQICVSYCHRINTCYVLLHHRRFRKVPCRINNRVKKFSLGYCQMGRYPLGEGGQTTSLERKIWMRVKKPTISYECAHICINKYTYIFIYLYIYRVTRWHSWLRRCATSRKVAGSIPDGVIGIFHRHNPSDRTMALGSTQPLTEMSTRNVSWGVKAAGA